MVFELGRIKLLDVNTLFSDLMLFMFEPFNRVRIFHMPTRVLVVRVAQV